MNCELCEKLLAVADNALAVARTVPDQRLGNMVGDDSGVLGIEPVVRVGRAMGMAAVLPQRSIDMGCAAAHQPLIGDPGKESVEPMIVAEPDAQQDVRARHPDDVAGTRLKRFGIDRRRHNGFDVVTISAPTAAARAARSVVTATTRLAAKTGAAATRAAKTAPASRRDTGTKLVAYHNTWPYFARRFQLDIVDFIEPKPGVSPSPFHLSRLIAKSRAAQSRAVIHEPYEPLDVSHMVAQKLGVPVIVLATSVASLPKATDYFRLFDHNVAALARALGVERR